MSSKLAAWVLILVLLAAVVATLVLNVPHKGVPLP